MKFPRNKALFSLSGNNNRYDKDTYYDISKAYKVICMTFNLKHENILMKTIFLLQNLYFIRCFYFLNLI